MCRNGYIYPSYDVTTDYDRKAPWEGPFYTDYFKHARETEDVGLDKCDWSTDYQYLTPMKDKLVALFNERYDYREIGQETYIRFQTFLNAKFNQLAPGFDRAFKMYENNDLDELGLGYEETEDYTRDYTRTEHAESTDTDTSKYKDTPTSVAGINNPTTQTDNNGTSEGDSTRTDTESYNRTHKKTQHDKHTIDEVNSNLRSWRNLANEFIQAFEPCFIQLLQ